MTLRARTICSVRDVLVLLCGIWISLFTFFCWNDSKLITARSGALLGILVTLVTSWARHWGIAAKYGNPYFLRLDSLFDFQDSLKLNKRKSKRLYSLRTPDCGSWRRNWRPLMTETWRIVLVMQSLKVLFFPFEFYLPFVSILFVARICFYRPCCDFNQLLLSSMRIYFKKSAMNITSVKYFLQDIVISQNEHLYMKCVKLLFSPLLFLQQEMVKRTWVPPRTCCDLSIFH